MMSSLAKTEFILNVLGFSHVERTLIASVCKLSQARTARAMADSGISFKVADEIKTDATDIFVVDADDQNALNALTAARRSNQSAPLVLVSREPREATQRGEYTLQRSRLGGQLLKQLDNLVQESFGDNAAVAQSGPIRFDSRKRCLVIDDSELVRTQMEIILQDFGLALSFAEDAETGLKLVKEKRFDVIFLDVMLPEMDGYKACKLLKADPASRYSKVIMLTSKKSPFNKMHGALVGCDKYLTKPVDADRVKKVLEQYGLIQDVPAAGKAGLVPA